MDVGAAWRGVSSPGPRASDLGDWGMGPGRSPLPEPPPAGPPPPEEPAVLAPPVPPISQAPVGVPDPAMLICLEPPQPAVVRNLEPDDDV